MVKTKDIITDLDKISDRCLEIDLKGDGKEARQIVSEIKAIMRAQNLKALSAPAIGYNKRIFCINFEDLEIKTFINPIICSAEGIQLSKETCTSIPGKTFIRPRNTTIDVMYQNPMGKSNARKLMGRAACVFQHELEHLEGITLADIGLEVDSDFENASEEEREEIIKMYLDSLDLMNTEIQNQIDSDTELHRYDEGIRFIESVNRGETILEKQEELIKVEDIESDLE